MAVYSGPKVVTDGMILHLDKYNEESYLGEPTVNLMTNPVFQNQTAGSNASIGWGTGYSGTDLWLTDDPPYGDLYFGLQCTTPNVYQVHATLTNLVGSTIYTVSYWIKTSYSYGTTLQNTMYIKGATNGAVVSGNMGPTTPEWQKKSHTFTTHSATQNYDVATYNYVAGLTVYISGIQIEEKAHATKFVDGTRSATNGWRDLSGNDNHANLTSLTYSTTNVPNTNVNDFSFNGSTNGNEITVPSSSSVELTSELTAEVWMNWESGHGRLFQKDSYSYSANRLWEMGVYNSKFRMEMWHSNGTSTTNSSPNTLTANIWYHLLMTFDGINIKMYENSVLVNTISFSGDIRSTSGDITIGGSWGTSEYHDGLISSVNLYNKALSAVEVLQNFNATKGRYGL